MTEQATGKQPANNWLDDPRITKADCLCCYVIDEVDLRDWLAEVLAAERAKAWDEGWEAARSESGLFCSRSDGCLPPGANERERYNQNPYGADREQP